MRASWQQPSGVRWRRVYALTKKGERVLAERQNEWIAFARVMNAVLEGG